MRRGKVIHQRRFRLRQAHGPGDFALVISTQFDHRIFMLAIQTQERHRHADIVIQIACGIKRVATLAEDRSGHLLNGGFTGRAGQRHNARRNLLANPCCQLTKGQAGIFYHRLRQVDIQFTAHQQRTRACCFRLPGKVVRIKTLTLQRHKQAAGGDFTRVGGDRIEGQLAADLSAQDSGQLA